MHKNFLRATALMSALACSGKHAQPRAITAFDVLLHPGFVRSYCQNPVPVHVEKWINSGKSVYTASFDLRGPGREVSQEDLVEKGVYYTCTVTVERAKASLPFVDRSEYFISGFGPDGGGGGLRFLTSDRGYSVSLELMNHLLDVDPELDLDRLAKGISDAYDHFGNAAAK